MTTRLAAADALRRAMSETDLERMGMEGCVLGLVVVAVVGVVAVVLVASTPVAVSVFVSVAVVVCC